VKQEKRAEDNERWKKSRRIKSERGEAGKRARDQEKE
jgi:hypothetical protein